MFTLSQRFPWSSTDLFTLEFRLDYLLAQPLFISGIFVADYALPINPTDAA